MTATTLRLDLDASRANTRWTMTVSFIVHVLILLWLALLPVAHQTDPPITEITLLEPGDLAPAGADAASAPAPAARAQETGAASSSARDVRFVRLERRADVEPAPQSADAFADAINARLATTDRPITASVTGAATTVIPASLFGSGPATAPSAGGGGTIALHRGGGGGGGPALDLHRGGAGTGYAPALVAATGGGGAPAAAPARQSESTARREIAGASLAGPIADRAVLEHPLPAYPDWAKKEAVEGSVTLYFVVRPDGGVKENVLIQKTAGFSDFDDNARTALRAWQFEPLRGGRTGEQWGTITFHFRLRDAG